MYACHCGGGKLCWSVDGRQTRNLLTLRVSSIHAWIKQPGVERE
jgi:hypothetical protein